MKKADPVYIKVGKVGSTFGVNGWLKIQSYTEFGASILDYQPWYLVDATNQQSPITIEDSQIRDTGILVKFAGIETPEEGRLLTGKFIEIDRHLLPTLPSNQYYWSDLIGLTVINKNGENLGKVIYLMETGSNDVLVVKGQKEHAIPYLLGSVILKVDLEKEEITVDWEII